MQLKMKPDIRRSPRLHPPPRRSPRIKEQQSSPQHPEKKQQEIKNQEQETTPRSYSPRQTPSPSKSIAPKSASKTSSSVKFRRTLYMNNVFIRSSQRQASVEESLVRRALLPVENGFFDHLSMRDHKRIENV